MYDLIILLNLKYLKSNSYVEKKDSLWQIIDLLAYLKI